MIGVNSLVREKDPVVNSISIGDVPVPLLGIIGSFIPHKNRIDSHLTDRSLQGTIWPQHETKLNEAHALVEQLYGALAISKLSKTLYAKCTTNRKKLTNKIVEIMSDLQDSDGGAYSLRQCVEAGFYLKVMRVFFFYKPEALWNYAKSDNCNEGYKRTILHSACVSNYYVISLPFIEFILQMDKTHQLGLTKHIDCKGETALARARNAFKQNQEVIKMLELCSSADVSPENQPPPPTMSSENREHTVSQVKPQGPPEPKKSRTQQPTLNLHSRFLSFLGKKICKFFSFLKRLFKFIFYRQM